MSSITCQICGEKLHSVAVHLKRNHDETTVAQYQALFPMAPLLSAEAQALLAKRAAEAAPEKVEVVPAAAVDAGAAKYGLLHEVFNLGNAPAAMNARGEPIKIRLFNGGSNPELVPDRDPDYIFDIAVVKSILMGLEMNIPVYLWGHAGVGKTTALEQVCAYTGRPFMRVQHTSNTEECDIEGGWRVNTGGEMVWQDGPLPECMKDGVVYCADEYDFGSPMVISLYQAVLENKPLRIKSANKVVRPHPDFRMVATGNTNGSGDETGLYAGTQIQNAANYERFGIVLKVEYMQEAQEVSVIVGKAGLQKEQAQRMVKFANMMRTAYERRDVAIPLSPRALINASKLGLARDNWQFGMQAAYMNRLPPTSAALAQETFQRVFG